MNLTQSALRRVAGGVPRRSVLPGTAILVVALLAWIAAACRDTSSNSAYNVTGNWTKVKGTAISDVVNFDLVETDGAVAGTGSAPNAVIKSFSVSGTRYGLDVTLNMALSPPRSFVGKMLAADSMWIASGSDTIDLGRR